MTTRASLFAIMCIFMVVSRSAHAQADLQGLPEAVSSDAKKWAVVFDFDTDSCYPAPAVSPEGRMNGGLRDSGDITGECRQLNQFKNANTYCRFTTIKKGGAIYTVYMYALYFEKDQAASYIHFGHRHDWEYALVWTKDGKLTHASFSAHGDVTTMDKGELEFDVGKPDTVKVVYHKDGLATHSFRPAKRDEAPENDLGKWVTPALVEWDKMKSTKVSNELFRLKFNGHDFGAANCSFNDNNFRNELAKNPPQGYPNADEWKRVALEPNRPRDYSKEPSKPEGLVARWYVHPGRDAGRDNCEVKLAKGQKAKIVVHLPGGVRDRFNFNLKHDKKNATDRGRTPRVGHGDVVSGDAHDWPGFGKRIYLGERNGSDHHGFDISPKGFYVDLVLVR